MLCQENLPVRRGKAGVEALSRAGRPVLGELSQNVTTRRNNARPGKQQLQQQASINQAVYLLYSLIPISSFHFLLMKLGLSQGLRFFCGLWYNGWGMEWKLLWANIWVLSRTSVNFNFKEQYNFTDMKTDNSLADVSPFLFSSNLLIASWDSHYPSSKILLARSAQLRCCLILSK